MAKSRNRVELLGHLGRDPEIRSFQNGGRVCNLNIATSEKWRDRNTGETRERTEWHRVAIFSDGLVGVAEKYLRKGSKVLIEGKLETRKYQDQSGNDRYSTEVVMRPYASDLIMLDGPREGGSDLIMLDGPREGGSGGDDGAGGGGYYENKDRENQGGGDQRNYLDDEIPF